MSPDVLVFDDGSAQIAPLTDLRASFGVRTGAWTMLERLVRGGWRVAGALVRPGAEALTRERHPGLAVNAPPAGPGAVLAVNGRWALPDAGRLASLRPGEAAVGPDGSVIAACVAAEQAPALLEGGPVGLRKVDWPEAWASMLTRPWSTRAVRDAAIDADLGALTNTLPRLASGGGVTVIGQAAHAHRSARVAPTAVLDAEGGPVVLDEGAIVRPGAILIGPVYVGPNSTVLERATIRPHTAVGPWCKVNGEVGGCVFQGYANKAHDGYLGDSWVGEWVNLGAGTTNSNLLNTYGEVIAKARPDGRSERTGQQFLGATIGDHVKTAICTRLYTGCVLGTGSMFAGTSAVSGCVAGFSWVTDEGARPYRFEKFLEVARAAMGRRKVTPGPAYVERLRELAGGGAG